MKKELFIVLSILFIAMLLTVGCGAPGDPEMSDPEAGIGQPSDESASELIVTDQMGREVTFDAIPERIISLSPSNTEVIFALGLGDKVVGVTEYCNYPPAAQEKEIVGGFSTPNMERIVELEPDLVVASTIHDQEVPIMEELGLKVLVIESATLAELYESMAILAGVTGVQDTGASLINEMQERIKAVQLIVEQVAEEDRVKVYYEVYSDPLMSAGRNALINEIISFAGGVNIFGDLNESYPQVSAEIVAERQPQVILYPDYHGTADLMVETMLARPGWGNIPAIVDNKVYAISDDAFARPGPRVVDAIEEAARIFYPELF